MQTIKTKKCAGCLEEKGLVHFRLRKDRNQLVSRCFQCESEARQKPSVKAAKKAYYREYSQQPENKLRKLQQGAEARNIEFTIDESHLPPIPSHCPVLGVKFYSKSDNGRDWSPSIDRIDNSKGYVPGNIMWMSHRANTLKSDASLSEMKRLAKFFSSPFSFDFTGEDSEISDDEKSCSKCGQVKSLSEFHKKKGAPKGVRSACKCCVKEQAKQARLLS
jgi:hypothetical protein